jgi:hypothetical protein
MHWPQKEDSAPEVQELLITKYGSSYVILIHKQIWIFK